VQVTKATVATVDEQDLLARRQQLCNGLARIEICDDCANRHWQDDIVASRAKLVRTASGLSIAGLMSPGVSEVNQRIEAWIGDREHTSAPPPIATVRSSERNRLFAPKAHATGTTMAGGNINVNFVYELH
jgi:hypothetical protein